MKILRVDTNNHKKVFEVRTRRGMLPLPYARVVPRPSADDRVERVYVDPELGHEGFTYELTSGREGSVHIDSVLEYNEDPGHIADLVMYRLTVDAQDRVERSELSRREIARRLGTSVPQLYRLLDPANYRKSLRQLLALLAVVGYEVDVRIRKRPGRGRGRGGRLAG